MLRPTRLLALGGLLVIALLYWKPLHTYEHTKAQVTRRQQQVAQLAAEKQELEQRLATVGSGQNLIREARRLGLVKPGEELFIVRGISEWRKRHEGSG
jgi:cell division protein FtsB